MGENFHRIMFITFSIDLRQALCINFTSPLILSEAASENRGSHADILKDIAREEN